MIIKFSKKYLKSELFIFFLISLVLDLIYNFFFWILDWFGFGNKFLDNNFTALIAFLGYYFSVIPIKILSVTFPDWYNFTPTLKYPISNSIWVFILEQSFIILFITITLFTIYIMMMWIKRIYNKFILRLNQKWSKFSIFIGSISLLYYLIIILSVIYLASQ